MRWFLPVADIGSEVLISDRVLNRNEGLFVLFIGVSGKKVGSGRLMEDIFCLLLIIKGGFGFVNFNVVLEWHLLSLFFSSLSIILISYINFSSSWASSFCSRSLKTCELTSSYDTNWVYLFKLGNFSNVFFLKNNTLLLLLWPFPLIKGVLCFTF